MKKFSTIAKNMLAAQAASGVLLAVGSPELAAVTNLTAGLEYVSKLDEFTPMDKGVKIASIAAMAVGTVASYLLARKFKVYRGMWYAGSTLCAVALTAAHTSKGKEVLDQVDQLFDGIRQAAQMATAAEAEMAPAQ